MVENLASALSLDGVDGFSGRIRLQKQNGEFKTAGKVERHVQTRETIELAR